MSIVDRNLIILGINLNDQDEFWSSVIQKMIIEVF